MNTKEPEKWRAICAIVGVVSSVLAWEASQCGWCVCAGGVLAWVTCQCGLRGSVSDVVVRRCGYSGHCANVGGMGGVLNRQCWLYWRIHQDGVLDSIAGDALFLKLFPKTPRKYCSKLEIEFKFQVMYTPNLSYFWSLSWILGF